MHITKKRVLLILALALMGLLLVAMPATASAATTLAVVGQPTNGSGYIGTPIVNVQVSTTSPTAAYYSLNATTTAGPTFSAGNEGLAVAYPTVGATVEQDGYNLAGLSSPALTLTTGTTVWIRVQFWTSSAETTLVSFAQVGFTYSTLVPVASVVLTDPAAGVLGQSGVEWFNTPAITATFNSTVSPLNALAWTVDGNAGAVSNPTLPYVVGPLTVPTFESFLNGYGGAGTNPMDGIHSVTATARSAGNVLGPTFTLPFGVDTKAPTITFTGLGAAFNSGNLTIGIQYTDPGGSGVNSATPAWTVYNGSGVAVASWTLGIGGAPVTTTDLVTGSATMTTNVLNPWETDATFTIAIPGGSDGSQWYVVASATDMVGNSLTTPDQYFGVDLVPPITTYTVTPTSLATSVTPGIGGGVWTNQPVTLNFHAVDVGIAGVAYTEYLLNPATAPILSTTGTQLTGTLTAGTWNTSLTINTTATTGVDKVYYRSVDKAGNLEPWNVAWVWFDNVPPVFTNTYATGVWMNNNFTVTLTATDANSELAAPGIQWDVPNWNTGTIANPVYGWNTMTPGSQSPATISFVVTPSPLNDGIFTLNYTATDVAGNVATGSQMIMVDTRAPVTAGPASPSAGGNTVWIPGGSNNFTLTATDQASGSGIAATWYRVDQATKWTVNTGTGTNPATPAKQAPVTLATPITIAGADGSSHTVDFASVDNSTNPAWYADLLLTPSTALPFPGNAEATLVYTGGNEFPGIGYKTESVKIDSVAPVTTVAGADSAWHAGPVTLFFTATDAQSGVAMTQWSIDGVNWTNGDQATISKNGTDVVSYRSVDNVGNVEATNTVTVNVDTIAPAVKAFNSTEKNGKAKVDIGYQVNATTPFADVTVVIKSWNQNHTLRTIAIRGRKTNTMNSLMYVTHLPKGNYHVVISAVDQAGLSQSVRGIAKLTIK